MESATVTHTSAVPGMRLETSRLIDLLKTGAPGDFLTDERMKEVCGKDVCVHGDAYNYLLSAIEHCVRVYSVTWVRLHGAGGIKCPTPEEMMALADSKRRHINRAAKRICRRLATADLNGLDNEARVKHLAAMAQLGTIAQFSSTETKKKLEVRKTAEPLNFQKLLEAMS
jgi:hypothetical protein